MAEFVNIQQLKDYAQRLERVSKLEALTALVGKALTDQNLTVAAWLMRHRSWLTQAAHTCPVCGHERNEDIGVCDHCDELLEHGDDGE